MKMDPLKDLAEARTVEAALRATLQEENPERAIGLAGCLLLAARTIAAVSSDQAELDDTLKAAVQLLNDQTRAHFATRQKSARRGRRTATQH